MAIDKNAVVKEAQKYIAKGQFDKAIAEWKKLLRETPSDPNIYNTIGDLCLKKDARMEAVDAYKRAADILAADGFSSKAIALYKKILNIDHQQIDVHIALGDLNAEKGLVGAALESYKLIADYYIHEHNMVKALGVYQKMADLNPSNIPFRVKLGDMYAKEGMNAEAAKTYLAAADAHVAKEAFQDARLLFEKVLSLDPKNKEVYHKAGLVYFKEGKFAEACKALKPAFESDPANRELGEMYLDALSKAGKGSEAGDIIAKIIAEDPSRIDLREKLLNVYLDTEDFGKALSEANALAQTKLESEGNPAVETLFKSFVARAPEFAPGREKLGEFYASINNLDDAAAELLEAATAYIAGGETDAAKAVLLRIMELVPGMPAARKKLEQLEAALAPLEPAPVAEVVEAAPAPEPEPAFMEPTFETPPPEMPVQPQAIEETEDPAVSAAFTEVDVLLKYGMGAKATEQLEALALQFSQNTKIHIKLRELYRDQANIDKAVEHALVLADLYQAAGKNDLADAELHAAQEIAPNNALLLSRLGITPIEAPAPPQEAFAEATEVAPPEILLDQLDIATTPPPPTSAFEEPAQVIEPNFPAFEEPAPIQEAAPAEAEEITFEELESEPPAIAPIEAEPEPQIEEVAEEAEAPVEAPAPQPVAEQASPADALVEVDISEIWAEAEFYYQQGLFDEAKKHYAKIVELAPNDKRAIEKLAEISREEDETREFTILADAVEELEDTTTTEAKDSALATSASDEEAVNRLMKEIAQINKEAPPLKKPAPFVKAPTSQPSEIFKKPEPPAPRIERETPPKREPAFAQSSTAPAKPKKTEESEFFDLGEELQKEVTKAKREAPKKPAAPTDYFDLAAELRDEISAAPTAKRSSVAPEDQSLDDIFEEFKKGVEQQAVKEDTDTHYNLGVAYKEMGLLDDAIAEFILTPEGKPWFVESRYLLGLCYLEKSNFQNAINEIRNALKYASKQGSIDDQDKLAMQFDLGLAYQGVGNIKAAIAEFQKVDEIDSTYRDVSVKLKELQQGEFISLAQLKDDIEKEISSKFLEEGERIERAEKSRRTDRPKE